MTLSLPRFFSLFVLSLAGGPFVFAQVPAPPPAPISTAAVIPNSTPLSLGWLKVTGVNQGLPPGQTSVEITYTSGGKEATASIPIEADTYLWKDSPQVNGNGKGLLLRDNRFAEALLKLDLSSIPKDAQIKEATLEFKVAGVQNKGQAGTFNCFVVKTPWTEDASWIKPSPDAPGWNGLKANADFDPAAFASAAVPSLDDKQKGGQIVGIPGFEKAVSQWLSGAVPNNGFLLTLSGKALQLSVPARETLKDTQSLRLGGAREAKILLSPNLPLFDRVLLKPDDILGAAMAIVVAKPPKAAQNSTAQIKLYETGSDHTTPGTLLGNFAVKDLPEAGEVDFGDLAAALKANLAGAHDPQQTFVLQEEGSAGEALPEILVSGTQDRKNAPAIKLALPNYAAAQLFGEPPVQWQPGVYTKVVDGHLNYNGKRLRLWGVVGFPHVDRLAKMGFNAQRVWEPASQGLVQGQGVYTDDSAKKGEFEPYVKGDGSRLDKADEHMADLKAHHFFVMYGGLVGTIPVTPLLADDSFVAGGDDWADWKAAVSLKGAGEPIHYIFVDERLQKIRKTHAKNLLTHVNAYTGKAYGQEENIAIYEVWNENGFVEKVLGGELAKWPPYFKGKLQKRWNAWLVDRYKDDASLKQAWGTLAADESLSNGSVAPAPDFDSRAKFPVQRGNNFIAFMIDLENTFNQDFRSYCRTLATAGVGVNVVPFSFDTYYRPNLQWAYTQNLGDVHSQGMYFWDLKSTLDKPPAAYVIDSYTPAHQPVVLYETNAGRPGPYRAEYPLKLAALASYQDWDGVIWHYWGPQENPADVAYLAGLLQLPNVNHYWAAVIHEVDPVMCSAMALGSRIFLGNLLPPAKDPEVVTIGKQALYSYSAFRGIDIATTTFSRGSRLMYAPKDDSGVTAGGQPLPPTGRIAKAIGSGDYVTWDWPNGRLIIDAPTVKAYVGRVDGSFRFSDGIVVGNINTPFICFAMMSTDGKPLVGSDASKRILMNGVFDAKNSGFAFDYDVLGGPLDQARAVHDPGHVPILVDKVGYQVWFPKQFSGSFKSYDFALREIAEKSVHSDNQVQQQGATPFMDLLEVDQWGGEGTLPVAQANAIAKQDFSASATASGSAATSGADATSGATCPIPGVDWTMDYPTAHKYLENSTLIFTSLSKLNVNPTANETVSLTGAQLPTLWNGLADIVLTFVDGKMSKIEVTFQQPPPVKEAIDKFSAALGQPAEKKLEAQYGTTEIHWPSRPSLPDVLVTESQGQMKIVYQAPSSGKS